MHIDQFEIDLKSETYRAEHACMNIHSCSTKGTKIVEFSFAMKICGILSRFASK